MKKHFCRLFLLSAALGVTGAARAQSEWPRSITTPDGTVINIYQPEVEAFAGVTMKSRSAISVRERDMADPVFGVCWSTDVVGTDRDRREVSIQSVKVDHIRIPADSDMIGRDRLRTTLESYLPKVEGTLPLDEVLASLDESQSSAQLSKDISNRLPKVIYRSQRSMLILIDGQPVLKKNTHWDVDMVVNTPATIVRYDDGKYYLYGGGHWYSAPAATGPYTYTNDKVKRKLRKIAKALKRAAEKNDDMPTSETPDNQVYDIVVSTTPAELIQSDGSPDLAPISGTNLLYVKNSDNDVFVSTQNQQYYILLSGRWYTAAALNENSDWRYVAPDQLPADFAKIPEGSPKDDVLASVPGTAAAREAVMDAQVPQTAKVDRRTAETHVEYDGAPRFKPVAGTDMQYAVNTSSVVLQESGHYYAVDNGIWFIADDPNGPWTVSSSRPQQMDQVPPDCPVYNAKYVYVYDSTPDYAYDGYTPGYLNSFVDGPTVVYGTGYDYDPWIGDYYYPRPWTWGFDMCYNPWTGWGFGAAYDYDWFDDGFGWGFGWDGGLGFGWGGWYGGGWWGGASAYRPSYRNWHGGRFRSDRRGGYYGRDAVINRDTHMHMRYGNNVYRGRTGVVAPDRGGFAGGIRNGYPLRGAQGGLSLSAAAGRSVYTDRQGNVYRRGPQGEWQQRVNRQWTTPANRGNVGGLERMQQMNMRGQVRTMNFQRASNFGGMRFGGGAHFGGGGHFGGGHFGGGHR